MNEKTYTAYKLNKIDDIVVSDATAAEFLREWGRRQVQYQRFLEPLIEGLSWQERIGNNIEDVIVNPTMFKEFLNLPEDSYERRSEFIILKKDWVKSKKGLRIWVDNKIQDNDVVFFDISNSVLAKTFPVVTEFWYERSCII